MKYSIQIIVFLICSQLQVAAQKNYKVISDVVNIRKEPNAEAKIQKSMFMEETLIIDTVINGWGKLRYFDSAYVPMEHLTPLVDRIEIDTPKPKSSFGTYFFLSFIVSFIILIKLSMNTTVKDGRFKKGYRTTKIGINFGGPLAMLIYALLIALLYSLSMVYS